MHSLYISNLKSNNKLVVRTTKKLNYNEKIQDYDNFYILYLLML